MFNFPKISELHKETQKEMGIPADENLWPASWKVVEYKEYPRFPKIILPEPRPIPGAFRDVLLARESKRDFDEKKILTAQELSDFLYWSAGLKKITMRTENFRRMHPSGGARYPLEIYLSCKGSKEIPGGVYHYHIREHALEKLMGSEGDATIRALPNYPWAPKAQAMIFISAILDRSMRKYRERGYRFALLEVGALLHNFYLVGTALEMNTCALGVNFDVAVERIIDLGGGERILSALVAGK